MLVKYHKNHNDKKALLNNEYNDFIPNFQSYHQFTTHNTGDAMFDKSC